jgi:probable HAF family extracellular repeat protein
MNDRTRIITIAACTACLGAEGPARAGDYLVLRIDPAPLGGTQAVARDINNLGQVVGTYLTTGGELRTFLWQGDIDDIDPAHAAPISGYAINDSGTIAGETRDGDGDVVAFRAPART